MSYQIVHGCSREVLAGLAPESVDACVTDPPYGLNFMGKAWDGMDSAAFDPAFWREVLRVLKPGAHLVAFGGTRTYHRLVCAVEDAGFEVRDQLAWLYGMGVPKSRNLKDADGARTGQGTALKPAHEPIVLARKPFRGTVAANVARWGTGALNIDACRVGTHGGTTRSNHAKTGQFRIGGKATIAALNAGRWPANLLHDASAEVVALFPWAGSSSGGVRRIDDLRVRNSATPGHKAGDTKTGYAESRSAARFFYSAKASAGDRGGSGHPTVKPVALMQWLVRLITPEGGLVLDPFAGSGTTGAAALAEGSRALLIEREAEYVVDIRRRMEGSAPPPRAKGRKAYGNFADNPARWWKPEPSDQSGGGWGSNSPFGNDAARGVSDRRA